ncbi:hypothetical protein Bca52824_047165 [Brassica carinata]|uniref:Uncharacterized protein n=1 Tax=Brassica carinata TaxID=52824 RepID=A0A8X7RFU1_BRACI|nr:hypothetical protein Bca52824_047165 [Brassica carinata]
MLCQNVAYVEHPIDPKEVKGYWAAMGHVELPIPGIWHPSPFRANHIEERIWKKWEPIPVSPDTVESETGAPDEAGEVNQTSVPLNVSDYSIGGSMTGYYEFDG